MTCMYAGLSSIATLVILPYKVFLLLFRGLRQCLAHFVSELSLLDPPVQYGVGGALYCVPAAAVNKLKSLAEDGNIDRWV